MSSSLWILALGLVSVLVHAGCGNDENSSVMSTHGFRPNVLVLTLDTTRPDHLGCYGHAAAVTPVIDALAKRGTRFEHAYAPVPLTLPSHATIWTGLQPPEHGIHDNGRNALAADVPHAAEILRSAGWSTGAFLSTAVLDTTFGLARGFDVYDDRMSAVDAEGDEAPPQRRGDATTDAAVAWIRTAREPLLGWVHFYDPHSTYDPPEPWRSRTPDPYDGEIAFVDSQIGRLLAVLEERGALERTIVVVTADHGESFGEHGEATHGLFVYDATMRVPLVFAGPGCDSRIARTPAELADIAPTILDLCGVRHELARPSLASVLRGAELGPRPVYGESEYGWLSFGWSPLRTTVVDGWRYVDSSDPELYDQRADPRELVDLADQDDERVARLDRELEALRAGFTPRGSSAAKIDEALASRLSSLGYAQSVTAPGEVPSDAPSPRAMTNIHEEFLRGVGFAQHGQADRAIPLLESAAKSWPRGVLIHLHLAQALLSAGRPADARVAAARAVELDPNLEGAHYCLGLASAMSDDPAGAIAHFDRALALQPTGYLTRLAKMRALVRLGRDPEAAEVLEQIVAMKPLDTASAAKLARIQRQLGRHVDAVRVLRAANRARPEDQGLALYLAWELATSPEEAARDGKTAVELAEHALKARGRSLPDELDTLAAAYAEAGRFEDAVATIDKALRAGGENADATLVAEWNARRTLYLAQRAFRDG